MGFLQVLQSPVTCMFGSVRNSKLNLREPTSVRVNGVCAPCDGLSGVPTMYAGIKDDLEIYGLKHRILRKKLVFSVEKNIIWAIWA